MELFKVILQPAISLFKHDDRRHTVPMILITGTPRSGTHYTAAVLQAIGLKLKHEKIDAQGTVSWRHIAEGTFLDPERNLSIETLDPGFTIIIHQVRQPLKSISSMLTLRPCSWDFMSRQVAVDLGARLPVRAMQAWLHWNNLIGERAQWRFRVEDYHSVFGELLAELGLDPVPFPEVAHEKRDSRSGRYPMLGWEHLLHADAGLAAEVAALAIRYGYEVPDLAGIKPVAPPFVMENTRRNRRLRRIFRI